MFTGEKERNEKQHIFHLNCEHFWRQKTSKNCRFSSRVRYLCDCCVRCPPARQSHLATGKSRFSQDLRWGVRPAASSSRETDLTVLPLPVWSHPLGVRLDCEAPPLCVNVSSLQLSGQAVWILALSVSFNLLDCSSREGEWGLFEAAPFSGSAPRLTNVGIELPTGGAMCLPGRCSTQNGKGPRTELMSDITLVAWTSYNTSVKVFLFSILYNHCYCL